MLLAQRRLQVGNLELAEGDIIREFAGRSWGPLMSTAAVVRLSPNAVNSVLTAAMPVDDSADPEPGVLVGSDIQPAMIDAASGHYSIGDLVSKAFRNSGLSLIAWNALPVGARETLIWAGSVLDGEGIPKLESYDDGQSPAGPGDPPDGPHMLFDPERHSLKYRGSVAGYWIVDDEGGNVAQINKADFQWLKGFAKDGASAYVRLAEPEGADPGAGVEARVGGGQAEAA